MKRYLLLLLAITAPALAEDARVTALIAQGDAEERQHHALAAVEALRQAEQIEPKNIGVLLRLSKQFSDLVGETKGPEAERHARRALDYARQAVALDDGNAKAHLSVAIGYGKLTDFVGNKTKVEYSKLIRDEAQRSLDLDAQDDFAWHVLGRWHAGIGKVSPVLRAMARVVYGGLPPASNEDAVRCLKKATELAPRRIIHRSELARVYRAMGRSADAAKEWQAVLALAAVDAEDTRDQREAREALAKP